MARRSETKAPRAPKPAKLPKLPKLLDRKLSKTGQTRGAKKKEIYQNRVTRNSTVLIRYPDWTQNFTTSKADQMFEQGYIVLISPEQYFEQTHDAPEELAAQGLTLGQNALVFYQSRKYWNAHNPSTLGWQPAKSRLKPLQGQYVARIAGRTAKTNGSSIIEGFYTTSSQGAGIRSFEYATRSAVAKCRLQLEALFWLCSDSEAVAVANEMSQQDMISRKAAILRLSETEGLLDRSRLLDARIINERESTICPLCLKEISGELFFKRMEQAEGREVDELTTTAISLFHITELRIGAFNHREYNLGWGHHHCNVVVKDAGIMTTLRWMDEIIERNVTDGHLTRENKSGIGK